MTSEVTATALSPEKVKELNEQLTGKSAEEIVRWAADTFGSEIAFASSFGAEDVALIDIISRVAPELPMFTLDTGRLHDETYEVMERVRTPLSSCPS